MHGTREIIQEATALPVEERGIVIDSLLRSLNVPDAETDSQWSAVAQRRLGELRGGRVRSVPGDQIFLRIKKRFARC